MNMNWILAPGTELIIVGAITGVGLIASLAVWIFATAEARASKKMLADFRASTETTIKELNARIDDLRVKPVAPVLADPIVPAPMTLQGMNLTNRTKALRMHRRGEAVPSIAAALGVQQEEIELLLKMDRLMEAPAA
jgi:hypothetical protein